MFGYRKLERRIEALEADFSRKQKEENCAKGIHIWALEDAERSIPYVRCRYCYAYPKKEK